jgi:hypothetical protein
MTELVAALLAGLGLGVGLAAIVIGQGNTARHLAPAAHTRATHTSRPLGPATAGVQPGREDAYDSSSGQTQPGATASQNTASILDTDAHVSFARLQSGLPGHVELTVAPLGLGTPETLGGDAAAHGWSTTKIPVLAALLKARGGQGLTPAELSWAHSAITESSNESVLHLFDDLERLEGGLIGASDYVQGLLRISGDEETEVATAAPPAGAATTFGQTEWKPTNAVKFFGALARGCLLPPGETDYVLGLMQHIEPSESWGLGYAGFRSVAFKGGWGPEPGGAYLVRQSGILDVGSQRALAVAIVAFPPAGARSFEAGVAMLTETATWLREHLRLVPRSSVPCT